MGNPEYGASTTPLMMYTRIGPKQCSVSLPFGCAKPLAGLTTWRNSSNQPTKVNPPATANHHVVLNLVAPPCYRCCSSRPACLRPPPPPHLASVSGGSSKVTCGMLACTVDTPPLAPLPISTLGATASWGAPAALPARAAAAAASRAAFTAGPGGTVTIRRLPGALWLCKVASSSLPSWRGR